MRKVVIVMFIFGVVAGFAIHDHLTRPAAAKVVVIQNRNLTYQVATTAETVGELLAEQGLTPPSVPPHQPRPMALERGQGEGIKKENSSPLVGEVRRGVVHGMSINISTPVQIILNDGGAETAVTTTAQTVNDFLNEQEIALAVTDRVTPGLDTYLGRELTIQIDRIVDLEVKEQREIPFATRQDHDPSSYYGRVEVLQPGSPGILEEDFLITYENGVEIARKKLAERLISEPVQELQRFGTRIEVVEERDGRASWYAYKACMCAAHPFYDQGRFVRVTALNSGKTIIVRINDHGPDLSMHPDRVIDLDSVAFKELAPLGAGTIAIRTELLR